MTQTKIIRALHLVLLKKIEKIQNISERVSILNHQIENYENMEYRYKKEVMIDLIIDLHDLGLSEEYILEVDKEFLEGKEWHKLRLKKYVPVADTV